MNYTDEQIIEMVDRFLTWQLPKDFCPDNGIEFTKPTDNLPEHYWPVGTNLFTSDQAEAMIRNILNQDKEIMDMDALRERIIESSNQELEKVKEAVTKHIKLKEAIETNKRIVFELDFLLDHLLDRKREDEKAWSTLEDRSFIEVLDLAPGVIEDTTVTAMQRINQIRDLLFTDRFEESCKTQEAAFTD